MSKKTLVRELQEIAAAKLHNTRSIPKVMAGKIELIEIAFGHARILEDFTAWCDEHADENRQYPVTDYIRAIDSRLGGQPRIDPNDEKVEELRQFVYEKVQILPAIQPLRDLLLVYEVPEIKAAFSEYIIGLEEKTMRTSLRAFFEEGGARVVIGARRKRNVQTG